MNAVTLVRDLSIMCLAIALAVVGTFALTLSLCVIATAALVLLPLLPFVLPVLGISLCMVALYRMAFTPVPSSVLAESEWLDDEESWNQFCLDDATLSLAFIGTELAIVSVSEEIQDSVTAHYPSPCDDVESGYSSMVYAPTSTLLADVDTVLSALTWETEEMTPSLCCANSPVDETTPVSLYPSPATLDYSDLSLSALVTLAKEQGVKGVNSRWKRETIVHKIQVATNSR